MFNNKKYWEERLQKQYDLQGVGDISLSPNYNRWSYKVTEKVLKRLINTYTGNITNKKAMDIGSGTGFVVQVLKEMGKDVTGVDISTTAVNKLSERYPNFRFVEFDMGSGPVDLTENSFGCCTAASVLYHIVDDEALSIALKNVHHVLQKDGIFIFSDNFVHDKPFNVTHQKCRTLKEYETLLKESGFEIINRVPNYVLMNDPIDARSKFYPRLWSRFVNYSEKSKAFDAFIWRFLYPIESLLVNVMKESPAQEFMICRAIK